MYYFRGIYIMEGLLKKEFHLKQAAHVILQIQDITGKLKANYNLGLKQAGNNVIQFENQNLESGIYFYTLLSENESFSGKMVVW